MGKLVNSRTTTSREFNSSSRALQQNAIKEQRLSIVIHDCESSGGSDEDCVLTGFRA